MTYSQGVWLAVILSGVIIFVAMVSVSVVVRSNQRLAREYQALRSEAMDQWRTYLDNEHRKVLSETAAAVARINAVAKPLLRANLPDEVREAIEDEVRGGSTR